LGWANSVARTEWPHSAAFGHFHISPKGLKVLPAPPDYLIIRRSFSERDSGLCCEVWKTKQPLGRIWLSGREIRQKKETLERSKSSALTAAQLSLLLLSNTSIFYVLSPPLWNTVKITNTLSLSSSRLAFPRSP
jgi:hypothetical protein